MDRLIDDKDALLSSAPVHEWGGRHEYERHVPSVPVKPATFCLAKLPPVTSFHTIHLAYSNTRASGDFVCRACEDVAYLTCALTATLQEEQSFAPACPRKEHPEHRYGNGSPSVYALEIAPISMGGHYSAQSMFDIGSIFCDTRPLIGPFCRRSVPRRPLRAQCVSD
jgi:hypothetical protein